jgi:hypothetical protein
MGARHAQVQRVAVADAALLALGLVLGGDGAFAAWYSAFVMPADALAQASASKAAAMGVRILVMGPA